jgi:hypothetical protein
MEAQHGPRHMPTLQAQAGLAAYYYDHARKLDEAERLLHDILARQQSMFGEDHRWTSNTHDTLGLLYRRQERHAEAVQIELLRSPQAAREIGRRAGQTSRSAGDSGSPTDRPSTSLPD